MNCIVLIGFKLSKSTELSFLFTLLQNIRSALVSKVLPIVEERCSLISAKVAHNTLQDTRHPNDLWLDICGKRDQCDKAMKKIKEVAFFFSSVAVVEKRVDDKECEEDEEDNEKMAN